MKSSRKGKSKTTDITKNSKKSFQKDLEGFKSSSKK
jgi:hypothetical protein